MSEQVSEGIAIGAMDADRVYSVEGDHHPFLFSGGAFEYFGIWISNLFLTVVTLGIYSAWAKVRRLRYFYGNTKVASHTFDYHGSPIAILKGRLLAVGFLILYNILITIFPLSIFVFLPLFLFLFPWVIVRSLRFNARMTSYRNVRFDFHGSYGGAFLALILWPIIGLLSFFTLMPFATRSMHNYLARNFSYGGRPFGGKLPIGPIYLYFFQTVLFFIGLSIVVAIIGFIVAQMAGLGTGLNLENSDQPEIGGAFILIYFLFLFVFVVAPIYYSTKVHNLLYNTVVLDQRHGFDSRLNPWSMVWIALSNLAAVAFSLGLLYPWSQIRLARYKAANTSLIAGGDLDKYTSQVEADSATGDALGDMLDFEIAL